MFEKLLNRIGINLDRYQIPYMVIGGQAVLLYGEPRLTRDIDITLGVSNGKLPILLEICQEIRLISLPDSIIEFVEKTMVLPTWEPDSGIRVDFIFSMTDYEQQAINRANLISLENYPVRFASPEDLIIHKIFAGRNRDLDDIRSILLKNKNLDFNYIRKWLNEFNILFPDNNFNIKFENILQSIHF